MTEFWLLIGQGIPVAILLLWTVRQAGESSCLPSLTGLTLTVAVVVTKEVLSVHASDLLAGDDVSQDLDTGSVPPRGHELARGSAVVVDVGSYKEVKVKCVLSMSFDWSMDINTVV